jgi:hypothetical protein
LYLRWSLGLLYRDFTRLSGFQIVIPAAGINLDAISPSRLYQCMMEYALIPLPTAPRQQSVFQSCGTLILSH